eukprot:3281387-Rhodomonas_salina.2
MVECSRQRKLNQLRVQTQLYPSIRSVSAFARNLKRLPSFQFHASCSLSLPPPTRLPGMGDFEATALTALALLTWHRRCSLGIGAAHSVSYTHLTLPTICSV